VGYYVHLNQQNSGPFSEEEIRAKFHAGEIKADTLVAKEGDTEWTTLSKTGLTQAKIQLKSEPTDSTGAAETSSTAGAESPSHDVAPPSSLQFDRADFAQTKSGAVTCSVCKQAIHDSYYQINRLVACTTCKDRVEVSGAGRLTLTGFGKSLLFGTGAAIAGAVIWYAVREVTGYELGLIGIVVGVMVGAAVKRGSRGWGGWHYQALAMFLTYFSIAGAYVPLLLKDMSPHRTETSHLASAQPTADKDSDDSTDSTEAPSVPGANRPNPHHQSALARVLNGLPGPLRYIAVWIVVFALACAVPVLAGPENFLGWIIIGIALYQAWKINRRVPLEISGPYKIAPAVATT
jgi:hypothetical protein